MKEPCVLVCIALTPETQNMLHYILAVAAGGYAPLQFAWIHSEQLSQPSRLRVSHHLREGLI